MSSGPAAAAASKRPKGASRARAHAPRRGEAPRPRWCRCPASPAPRARPAAVVRRASPPFVRVGLAPGPQPAARSFADAAPTPSYSHPSRPLLPLLPRPARYAPPATADPTPARADSDLYQQRLKAWQPILTPFWAIVVFSAVGVLFVALGFACQKASQDVVELRLQYDGAGADAQAPACAVGNFYNGTKRCRLTLTAPSAMKGPLFVYYELTNFYQNHRRYIKSRDDPQLAGLVSTEPDNLINCDPLRVNPVTGKVLHPCGLMANSMFNDSFLLNAAFSAPAATAAGLDEKGIAWATDLASKFKAVDQTLYRDKVQYINDTYPGVVDNVDNEHFIVWMRPAALPSFRKLYGRIRGDLAAGDKLVFDVDARYPVTGFSGTKAIVVTTLSFLGGKNAFIGGAYLVVGFLCLGAALLFGVKQAVAPARKLGDAAFLVSQSVHPRR